MADLTQHAGICLGVLRLERLMQLCCRAAADLSLKNFLVLDAAAFPDGVDVARVEAMLKSRAAARAVTDAFVRRGLVTETRSALDRRARAIRATSWGETLARQVADTLITTLREVFAAGSEGSFEAAEHLICALNHDEASKAQGDEFHRFVVSEYVLADAIHEAFNARRYTGMQASVLLGLAAHRQPSAFAGLRSTLGISEVPFAMGLDLLLEDTEPSVALVAGRHEGEVNYALTDVGRAQVAAALGDIMRLWGCAGPSAEGSPAADENTMALLAMLFDLMTAGRERLFGGDE